MSAEASRLAGLLLKENFGDLVAQVGLVLIENGKQTLTEVVTKAHIKKSEVQKSLVVLIQHGLVVHEGQSPRQLYSFHFPTLLRWSSFAKYIALAKIKYGDAGEVIIEDLLKNGQSLISEVIARLCSKFEGTDLKALMEAVKTTFVELLEGGYITGVVSQAPGTATTGDGDSCTATATATPTGGSSVGNPPPLPPSLPLPPQAQQPLSNQLPVGSSNPADLLPVLKTVMARIGQSQRKRQHSEDNEEEEPSKGQATKRMKKNNEEPPVDKGMYWRVNTDKFEQLILHEAIVDTVLRRIDNVAASVMEAVFATFPPSRTVITRESSVFHVMDVLAKLRAQALNVETEQVQAYFRVLCTEKYIKSREESGRDTYVFDYKQAHMLICQGTIEAVVMERFGSKSHRIFRLILLKKYLDQQQISDLALVPQKEAKEFLYTLMAENFVAFQDVPRTLDYASSRSFFLFTVNLPQVARLLLERCYKTAANVKIRWASEKEDNRRLLERKKAYDKLKEELEGEGAEEELEEAEENLSPKEQEQVEKIETVLSNLECVEMRVCETIRTLTLYLACLA